MSVMPQVVVLSPSPLFNGQMIRIYRDEEQLEMATPLLLITVESIMITRDDVDGRTLEAAQAIFRSMRHGDDISHYATHVQDLLHGPVRKADAD